MKVYLEAFRLAAPPYAGAGVGLVAFDPFFGPQKYTLCVLVLPRSQELPGQAKSDSATSPSGVNFADDQSWSESEGY
jgi:hypothetical protein